jgi:predicted molibdopterin-dependent oxidoreductase YjgC
LVDILAAAILVSVMPGPRPASKPLFARLPGRRSEAIEFVIDGKPARALLGDWLITAILANRGDLRRFEFTDRMRAGFCLMGACQDCWVDLADGRRVRACTTLVEPGLHVRIESGAP